MTLSALVASKCTPTRGSQSESGPRTRSKGAENTPACSWWSGAVGGEHADFDGDALRRHLLPGLDLPLPPAEPSQRKRSETAQPCLSPLYSHDFLPSVLADNKGERVYAEAAQPCTKQDLQKAVAALVALNRAQSENIQALRHQWSLRHFELGGKITTLETSLRQHHSLLVRIIENVRSGRLHALNWNELEQALPHLRQESSELSCADTRDLQARDQEATWEANDVLSDAPANWTSKLFDWCSRVDCLPIAEVALSDPLADSCAQDKASVSSETGEGDVEPLSTASDEEEQIHCEGQGLRLHVMGAGGAALSPAAERDAERFRDFIRNASLRQEAWMETFSSFAVTAVPIADLSRTTSLKLLLLDEAVTLPDTDMLLLVAESLGAVGSQPQKVGLRVLCLLERAVAARCSVRSGSLRKGALVEVHAFEPFCAVVQPEEEESSSVSTKRKLLTIPICSLQKIRLARAAASPEAASSACNADSAKPSGASEGVEVSASTSTSAAAAAAAAAAVEGVSRRSTRREIPAGGGGGEQRPAAAEKSAEATQHSLDGGKKRKICGGEEAEEAQKGERRSEASERRETVEPQKETPEQRRQQRAGAERQEAESACMQQSSSRDASSRKQCSYSMQGGSGLTKGSAARESGASRSSASDREAPSRATSPPAHACRQQSGGSGDNGAAGSRALRAVASSGAAACSRAPTAAAAAESSSRRTATGTSVRCSAHAAQQQLEQARQHLPRVRAVLPRQLRQQLPAFDCEECASFYGMVGGGPCGDRITCKHKKLDPVKQAKCSKESEGQQSRHEGGAAVGDPRMWSRHRQFAPPPSTPPGYWDL